MRRLIHAGLFAALLTATPYTTLALVFNNGPSDPGLFTNGVYDVGSPAVTPPNPLGNLQQLNLSDGGLVGDYYTASAGSEVNITGGSMGEFFFASAGSELNISGGSIGSYFNAEAGSTVNISGGSFGRDIGFYSGGEATISGGTFGGLVQSGADTVLNISGGDLGDLFFTSGVVNITGGTFGNEFVATAGSEINLYVTELRILGQLVTILKPGDSAVLDSTLQIPISGLLQDGTPYEFEVAATSVSGGRRDFFDADSTVTVFIVPEPSTAALLVLGTTCLLSLRRRRATVE